MSTVPEIERAIEKLPSPDLTRLARWILERDNENWDRQMNEDAANGKLDFLVKEPVSCSCRVCHEVTVGN